MLVPHSCGMSRKWQAYCQSTWQICIAVVVIISTYCKSDWRVPVGSKARLCVYW